MGVLASCSPGDAPVGEESPEPAETMTDPPEEFREGFETQSGLTLPSDAENPEIEGTRLEGERPYYELRFATTRGGAEVFCTADNLGTYRGGGGPTDEEYELFSVREDVEDIEMIVECTGAHPSDGRVDREALVVLPEEGLADPGGEPDAEDAAVVYAYTVELPNR
ncbi:hypothetical protein FHX37_1009 [Haloactinospora alba]|uniref:Uncharacterized protein n=2 Tax=Haloactinospora alba TaxID=405555 RepID=A0A543NH37_9ACTN|nr:hypothetical protein FHX37_1009 [Haloactinospora alba]